jgi:hypothetical protein
MHSALSKAMHNTYYLSDDHAQLRRLESQLGVTMSRRFGLDDDETRVFDLVDGFIEASVWDEFKLQRPVLIDWEVLPY